MTNTDELLIDIKYINQKSKLEIKALGDHLRQCITDASLPETSADSLVNEISGQLGRLTTRVKLIEDTIGSIQAQNELSSVAIKSLSENADGSPTDGLCFTAVQLTGNGNMLPVESSADGIIYRWSGSNPEIQFTFSLDRSKALGMRIRLFALIKPEFSKQLRVIVDGQHLKHTFGLDDSLFVVSSVLPASDRSEDTDVKIVLPSSYSPMELGTSHDGRKLGIAITDIHFGQPDGGFIRLLKRLKLKR